MSYTSIYRGLDCGMAEKGNVKDVHDADVSRRRRPTSYSPRDARERNEIDRREFPTIRHNVSPPRPPTPVSTRPYVLVFSPPIPISGLTRHPSHIDLVHVIPILLFACKKRYLNPHMLKLKLSARRQFCAAPPPASP